MPMLHYVILRHEGVDSPHFDLMFEREPGSALATWRSDHWPIDSPTPLESLGDHRRAYLEYEGPISGGRGYVRRVGVGQCRIDLSDPSRWTIRFDDGRLLQLTTENSTWHARPLPPA